MKGIVEQNLQVLIHGGELTSNKGTKSSDEQRNTFKQMHLEKLNIGEKKKERALTPLHILQKS